LSFRPLFFHGPLPPPSLSWIIFFGLSPGVFVAVPPPPFPEFPPFFFASSPSYALQSYQKNLLVFHPFPLVFPTTPRPAFFFRCIHLFPEAPPLFPRNRFFFSGGPTRPPESSFFSQVNVFSFNRFPPFLFSWVGPLLVFFFPCKFEPVRLGPCVFFFFFSFSHPGSSPQVHLSMSTPLFFFFSPFLMSFSCCIFAPSPFCSVVVCTLVESRLAYSPFSSVISWYPLS